MELIDIIVLNNINYINATELQQVLGSNGKFSQWIKRQIKRLLLDESIDYIIDIKESTGGRRLTEYILTMESAISIVRFCNQSKHKLLVYQYLSKFINRELIVKDERRDELIFLDNLEDTLIPFNIKGIRQFNVSGYKIDYYIESHKLAIEYDELFHKNNKYGDLERQQYIENKLNCKFIRIEDKYSDNYNIGIILKAIFCPDKYITANDKLVELNEQNSISSIMKGYKELFNQ